MLYSFRYNGFVGTFFMIIIALCALMMTLPDADVATVLQNLCIFSFIIYCTGNRQLESILHYLKTSHDEQVIYFSFKHNFQKCISFEFAGSCVQDLGVSFNLKYRGTVRM